MVQKPRALPIIKVMKRWSLNAADTAGLCGPAALLLCLLTETAAADERMETLQVREDCFRGSQITTEVKLSSGVANEFGVAQVPLSVTIPAGFDGDAFETCLERAGIATDVDKTAYLQRQSRCKEHARRSAEQRVRIAGSDTPRISAGFDHEAYAACLDDSAGVEVEIPAR